MANVSLMEQLNEAVEAILANPDSPPPQVSVRITELLRIAADLRDLPRADFKDRLKAEIMNKASIATLAIKPTRRTVTPYLIANEAGELIEFVKHAFGAEELFRTTWAGGGIHAEISIGDSVLMVGASESSREAPHLAGLHLYVDDSDAVYNRALEAGAESIYAPMDQPYGDREAGVRDLAGNYWFIASSITTEVIPSGFRSVAPYLLARGAPGMLDFLKRAFSAEEEFRAQSPDGVIHHAKIKIGESVVEMGEAYGDWQPTTATFYLNVNDVDAWYRQAVEAGAASISEPANQPYGERVAGVRDPGGNDWYIATPVEDAS